MRIINSIKSRYYNIVTRKRYLKEYREYKKFCRENKKREYIMFSTPIHGNIGDHAITYAQQQMLADKGITAFEIPTHEKHIYMPFIIKQVSKDAVILINGGGFLGNQWMREENLVREVISKFKDHKIIIFPQTIFYTNDVNGEKERKKSIEIYTQAKDLHICVREQKSYDLIKKMLPSADILLVPDIVLYLNEKNMNKKRDGILVCLRHDAEKKIDNAEEKKVIEIVNKHAGNVKITDTVISQRISKQEREAIIQSKLEEFAEAKLVITDRLHGMIFSAITNTPCIVMSNYNYKVKGVYEWIKELPYICYLEDISLLEEKMMELEKYKNIHYGNILKDKYRDLLEKIGV